MRGEAARSSLTIDQWASYFGSDYAPLLTQTWAADKEEVAVTAAGAYEHNGPVFSLVLARMQVFSQARFAFTRFGGGKPGDLFGTTDLSLLERPWQGGTSADLLARMEMWASLAGTAYVRKISGNRLSVLRPDWVTIVLGSNEEADHPSEASDAEIAGYIYKPPNGRGIVLEPFEVAPYAPYPSPHSTFLGQSWITAVLRDIAGDNLSVTHKRKFFENAATPNLAIKFDPAIKREQVLEFKEILEAEHKGAWNAYKTLYLGGGAEPVAIGKDFKELDFAITQGKGESRLASAAGVPPSWVGFSEGLQGSALNAGNFNSARRRFADGTMHHLWSNAVASLEPLISRPHPSVSLWYDLRGVPFMREDAKAAADVQTSQAATIGQLVNNGFTAESAVAAVRNNDWTLLKHTGLLSVQLQPAGSGKQPPTPTSQSPEEESDDDA